MTARRAPVVTPANPPSSGPVTHRWRCPAGHNFELRAQPSLADLMKFGRVIEIGCDACGQPVRHVWPEFVECATSTQVNTGGA